jgi:arginine:pyruvate transaminase
VTVLAGAQCALFCVAQCVLNPGDEVIVAEPMYVTYEAVFGACGAKVVPVPVRSEHGFRVQPEDVAARITPRTRALALNSPHNPSGASLPRSTWEALAELCIAHDLWLISDEVYSELLFDGEHISPASLPGMAERTATLNSLSKSHAMTGWRVGWVVAPLPWPRTWRTWRCACSTARRTLSRTPRWWRWKATAGTGGHARSLPPAPRSGVRLPGRLPGVRAQARWRHVRDGRYPRNRLSAQAFADRLLDRHGVSVLAGEAFGPSAAGHIRLGLVLGAEPLREACQRIARVPGTDGGQVHA